MLMQLSCGCCIEPLPPVLATWTRSQTIVSPMNSNTEVSEFTTPWTYGLGYFLTGFVPAATVPFWHLKWSSSVTATPATAATANPRYIVRMAPIRVRAGDAGYTEFATRNTRQFLSRQSTETAFRNLSPAVDGHSGAAAVTRIIVAPPLGTIYSTQFSAVKHVRVWINGVDITGILSVNCRATAGGSQIFACGAMTINISPTVITSDDVVEFDYWYEMNCTRSEGYQSGHVSGLSAEAAIVGACPNSWYSLRPNLMFRAAFNSLNVQSKRRTGDKYRLTFSSNGPGGVTELTLEPQTDWSFQQTTATMIQMTKTAGTATGNRVWFNWGKEIPEIVINKQITSPVAMFMRYLPADSNHYLQMDGATTPGVWNPRGSSVFSVRGIEGPNGWGGIGYMDSSSYPSSYFSSYPTSITVEKV